jgi:hypothetical protein
MGQWGSDRVRESNARQYHKVISDRNICFNISIPQEEDGGMMHGRGIVIVIVINEDEEKKGVVVDRRLLEDSKRIKTRDFVWKMC